tara:strand:+ start:843 stop:1019 length:177 start_codon:yes stop_codon:yes gene_type:complete
MLSGPIIGSILFELGGFKLPFFVVGVALFLLTIPISIYVPNDKNVTTRASHMTNNTSM